MNLSPEFKPGFRFSLVDAVVIFISILSSFDVWSSNWTLGFIILFVVGHFFLFCNVFRIARKLELIWAVIFCILIISTIPSDVLPWTIATSLSLVTTVVVIGIEMTKTSYHGIGWSWINPNLRNWWDASTSKHLS